MIIAIKLAVLALGTAVFGLALIRAIRPLIS